MPRYRLKWKLTGKKRRSRLMFKFIFKLLERSEIRIEEGRQITCKDNAIFTVRVLHYRIEIQGVWRPTLFSSCHLRGC